MQEDRCTVLSIAPYRILPATSGGHLGIVSLHDYLGKICDDHILSTSDNASEEKFSFRIHRIFTPGPKRYIPYYHLKEMVAVGREYNADCIFCDHPYMVPSVIALAKKLNVQWYLRSHNIESERFRTLGKKWWKVMFWFERYAMRKANGVFFITPEDAAWAKKNYNLPEKKCHIIPYGTVLGNAPEGHAAAKRELAETLQLDASKNWLYFLGALDYAPNTQAVNFILDEIMPRLDKINSNYQVLIAGKGLPAELQQKIEATGGKVRYLGFVPVLDTFLKAADIMLNPVLIGGGIKTKAVEALGYSKVVISSESGAAGILPEVCGNNLVITPDYDWDAFATATANAFNVTAQIPEAFYKTYFWGNIAQKIKHILQSK